MSNEWAVVVFGLASAVSWGAGDFCGGLAARRAHVFNVVLVAHIVGLLSVAGLALITSEPLPTQADLMWGVASGLAGGLGLAALYQALAVGRMGIAAPITAVLAAAVPVLVGAVLEGLPNNLQLLGFAVALGGIWLLALSEGGGRPEGLGLAIVAGLGIGGFLVLIAQVSDQAVFWPLAASRVASTLFMLGLTLVTRHAAVPDRRALPLMAATGVLDVGGNALFVLAAQAGRLDVAAVLSSLYPASTVILARLVLGERVTRLQAIGIVAVLVAVVLIAL